MSGTKGKMERDTSILELKGVGEKTQKLFAKVEVATVGELLYYLPRDYEDFRPPVPLGTAVPGEITAVSATVGAAPATKKVRQLTISSLTVSDSSEVLQLRFFNMPFLKNILKPNQTYVFRGMIQKRGSVKLMEQPRIYSPEEYGKLTGVLQPRYSLTKGLSNLMVQKAVKQAVDVCAYEAEYYPPKILEQYQLLSEPEALRGIHFPKDYETLQQARRRLVFDEFFAFLLLLQKNKECSKKLKNSYPMMETADTVRFLEKLPFSLTQGQEKTWREIQKDCAGDICMNRLVQGDVGSGKTVVAVLALLMCAANGYQGALMAPTEVLAQQHYETICAYTKQYGLIFRPALLLGSQTAKEKKEIREKIESGEANLVIGTHALIQNKVNYRSLALVVTDEQHRFGVRQRENLAQKGQNPHVLVMSATPIPRTLAIIMYGDLQISVIRELPSDRLPIKNCVVNTSYRPKAYEFIQKQVAQGRQAYVICPQVEAGETQDMENVTDYAQKLRSVLPPSVQVACLHGKMRPAEKKRIMEEFAAKNIDVLVSTTVIEVGINVPNATVMLVENAERFGLAQLHQLRGRVGRGEHQSFCIFMSGSEKKETMERLEILNRSNDGFLIASEDLKLRGPGELFGLRQSGALAFRVGDIYTDAAILQEASEAVTGLLAVDPDLSGHPLLREHFLAREGNFIDFRTI